MNSTATPGLSLPSHFTYDRYEPNHTVEVAKNQRLGLPSGLISDLRNALDAVMHGKNPEQASKHLLADLRRLHQHLVPERSPEHPRNQPHQPLIMTVDDLKAQAKLAEQLQNDPNVIRDLEGRKVDLASWDALTEHASFLHDHPVADKVICELRAFLDADRSGKDIDRFVAALRTDLEAFLANTQRSDADLQLELMAALRNT